MNGLHGQTIVLRVDEPSLADDQTTLFADIAFFREHAVRPIVVAPNPDAARSVVRTMNRTGDSAVGLSGADAGMIPAAGTQSVGAVQTRLLRMLLDGGYVPVIEPLALGFGGADIAVGADSIASALAQALTATRAIFFNDAGGVVDPQTSTVIDELTPAEALDLAEIDGCPASLRAAIRAAAFGVRGGVAAAQIVDGRIAHAAIVEFLTARHLGTFVTGGVFVA